jgi:hypothetical protein
MLPGDIAQEEARPARFDMQRLEALGRPSKADVVGATRRT